MAKARRIPVRGDLVHKKAQSNTGRRSVCGRYGYVTYMWRSVNCDVCLNSRESKK